MTEAIHTQQLTKRFRRSAGYKDLIPWLSRRGEFMAVNGVDLQVREGELFGLVGPNGAGKTTLIKILCTLLLPTSGIARIFGCDVAHREHDVKKLVGLVTGEERSFYWRLSGRQNLRFFASLYRMSGRKGEARIDEMLELLGMAQDGDRRFQDYSSGMKQKLAIARGLLSSPSLLFMDEPTRSLDPISARDLRRFVKEEIVERQGRTVLLTTHQMAEAEELCDRVAIMSRGRIVACGTVNELRARFQEYTRYQMEISGFPEVRLPVLGDVPGVVGYAKTFQENGCMTLDVKIREGALSEVLKAIINGGGEITSCDRRESALQDIFMHAVEGLGLEPDPVEAS